MCGESTDGGLGEKRDVMAGEAAVDSVVANVLLAAVVLTPVGDAFVNGYWCGHLE